LGDEVSNFSNTISSNSSKEVPFFSTLSRSTAPSQVLISKDASTVASQSTRISPCRCPFRTVGLDVAAFEQHVVIA
jgi:hypothetical protein